MRIDIELDEILVRAEGDYVAGSKSYYDRIHGNWLPGESPEIARLKVFIGNTEITHELTDKQLKEIESAFIDECEEIGA